MKFLVHLGGEEHRFGIISVIISNRTAFCLSSRRIVINVPTTTTNSGGNRVDQLALLRSRGEGGWTVTNGNLGAPEIGSFNFIAGKKKREFRGELSKTWCIPVTTGTVVSMLMTRRRHPLDLDVSLCRSFKLPLRCQRIVQHQSRRLIITLLK